MKALLTSVSLSFASAAVALPLMSGYAGAAVVGSQAVVSATAATAATASGGSAAPRSTASPTPKAVPTGQTREEFVKAVGVPLEDAGGDDLSIALERAVGHLDARLAAAKLTVNATMMDRARRGLTVVLAPGTARPAITAIDGFPVRYQTATYALAEGEALLDEILADKARWSLFDDITAPGAGFTAFSVDPATGVVKIVAAASPAAAAQLENAYGDRITVTLRTDTPVLARATA